MTRRYCIENLDTGLYFLAGEWAEEPEWFDSQEVSIVLASHPLIARTQSPTAVRPYEFDSYDFEG